MKWTPEQLEPFRSIGDKEADDLFERVYEEGKVDALNACFKVLATSEHNNITKILKDPVLIKDFEDYLESLSHLPAWADEAKMNQASEFFKMHAERIGLLLFVKSLPTCYTCAKGAKVLNMTGRIEAHDGSFDSMTRRLLETGQFIFNVCAKFAFNERGRGFISVQKVRLMHASIRTIALKHGWDTSTYDHPINQEDLAGTLLTFSTIILQGLEQSGLDIKQSDKEAYMHLWKVVGSMMGVQDELLVEDPQGGKEFMDTILKHQQASSEDGIALTASCISFLQYHLKRKVLQDEPARFMRFFIGDEAGDMLAIADHEPRHWLVRLLEIIFNREEWRIGRIGKAFRGLIYLISYDLIRALRKTYNKGKEAPFHIPSTISGD
jgi:hypothetical protein